MGLQTVKVALLGIGNVGSGVWRLLEENAASITNQAGGTVEIAKVLVRDLHKKRNLTIPKQLLTESYEEILEDDSITIVVELMGGIEKPRQYISRALRAGKHVVTANKAVIAIHGLELLALAQQEGRALLFEGSVAGGIPIIATITSSLASNRIHSVEGIINGTTNYILSKMTKEGMGFDKALKKAQEKGYAEADPTSDVEGEDAAYKLSILAMVAFGIYVSPADIKREGITRVTTAEIDFAKKIGYVVKLLAKGQREENWVEMSVHPTLVPEQHPLASVNDSFNALLIKGNGVGDLMLYGKGAGSLPTGSAVLADILHIAGSLLKGQCIVPSSLTPQPAVRVEEGPSSYYIRLEVADQPGVLGRITTLFGQHQVSLATVMQDYRGERTVPLVFVTHETERKVLDEALQEIGGLDCVREVACLLKVMPNVQAG